MTGQMWYSLFNLLGFIAAFFVSRRMKVPVYSSLSAREKAFVFMGLVLGVILGAKIPVFISFGFDWKLLITGKSIYGALIGAYIGVNFAKKAVGIKTYTGDKFVMPICIAVMIAKFGCLLNGCCGGTPMTGWFSMLALDGTRVFPTQFVCIGFHLTALIFFYILYRRKLLPGLHYIIYVLAYSIYRFSIEFVRVEPRLLGNMTIYQLIAIPAIIYFTWELIRRLRETEKPGLLGADYAEPAE